MMCSGASLDEVLFHVHGLIERVGWAVVPVVGRRPSTSWACTIGLVEIGHPELLIVGRAPEAAGRLLNSLGKRVRLGESFEGVSTVQIGRTDYSLEAVPQKRFEGDTFALWVNYYGALGPPHPERRALQVLRQHRRS